MTDIATPPPRREGEYEKLVAELYQNHPEITFPPEYAYFTRDNLLQFLIRLARYKFIARQLRPSDEVLEIGCGSGLGAIFLAQHACHVTGLDLKEYEIEEAARLNRRDNLTFEVADFFTWSTDKKYNVIVLLDVIEHLDPDRGRQMIEHTTRFLKPEGFLALGTPSRYSYEYQSAFSQAAHICLYDQTELLNLVESYYNRALAFSMNDELVHTGFAKLAWYYFVLAFGPRPPG